MSRLAALLHDIGKPATRRFEAGGKVSFHHHDVVGAKLVRKRLKALRYSADEVEAVAKLIELHLRFHGYGDGQWTDSAVRRYVRDAGDQLDRLHVLTRADCTTRNKAKADRLRRAYDSLEARIDELAEEEELAALRPDLDGTQIMAILDIPPGREVGEAYRYPAGEADRRGPVGSGAGRAGPPLLVGSPPGLTRPIFNPRRVLDVRPISTPRGFDPARSARSHSARVRSLAESWSGLGGRRGFGVFPRSDSVPSSIERFRLTSGEPDRRAARTRLRARG